MIVINPKKVWDIASAVIGVGGYFVSMKVESNRRETLKCELKQEIIKDLCSK